MIKAILFDLFGTLVDNPTIAQFHSFHTAVAETLGMEPKAFEGGWMAIALERATGAHGTMDATIEAAAAWSGSLYDKSTVASAAEIRRRITREWLQPRPDALATISQLRSLGIKIGLLSNCTLEVPEMWPLLAFAPLVDNPLFSCVERLRKPMPEFFLRALDRLDVKPAECLYVADGDNGEMAAATTLGMPAILIRTENDEYRYEAEDWDGPRIERLSELLHLEILK